MILVKSAEASSKAHLRVLHPERTPRAHPSRGLLQTSSLAIQPGDTRACACKAITYCIWYAYNKEDVNSSYSGLDGIREIVIAPIHLGNASVVGATAPRHTSTHVTSLRQSVILAERGIGQNRLEPGICCAPPQRLLAVKTNDGPFGQLRCLTQNVSFWSNKAAGKTFSVLEGF
jgi:hypothetical protein